MSAALPDTCVTCSRCGARCLRVRPDFMLYRHTALDRQLFRTYPCYGPSSDEVLAALLQSQDLLLRTTS